MAKREKFGKLVLLEETESAGLGPEFRAAKLGVAGLEKIVTILRLKPAVSSHAEAARSVMDQAKIAAQLQNPNVLKIFGIGKVDQTYYVSYELVEGKSLRAVLEKCRQEGFPFSVEHALLIASKVCSALEYAHGRRGESGTRYFHGLLNPASILVSYEGEVRVKGFGYWPSRLREMGLLEAGDLRYLAPEQAAGGVGDHRSDIYALGAVLLETLTGQVPEGGDLLARVPGAKLLSPSGDEDVLPPAIVEVVNRSLAHDPAARYAEVPEMRKGIDTLLFSGDFTPTTFNLAFFMHSLYREDIDREAKTLKEEKEASYAEFLTEEPPRSAPPRAPAPSPARAEPAETKPTAAAHVPEPVPVPAPVVPTPPATPTAPHDSSPGLSAKEAAASFTFHKEEKPKSKAPLIAGAAVLLLIATGAAYVFLLRAPAPLIATPAPPPTLSPEAVAAQQRVKELEAKLAELEAQKAAEEAKAVEETKRKMEAQARARGQEVDQAALQRAQEEARRKSRAEQERRQQEELRRLEEGRRAEEARLTEEQAKVEPIAAAARVTPALVATPEPTPPSATLPPLRPGTLVNLSDPGVIAPVADRTPPLVYPPIAERRRVEGVVELNVLIDDKGSVVDVQLVQGAEGRSGLNEAAIENVKKRRYRPATKDGVPVKVWQPVRVKFELPR